MKKLWIKTDVVTTGRERVSKITDVASLLREIKKRHKWLIDPLAAQEDILMLLAVSQAMLKHIDTLHPGPRTPKTSRAARSALRADMAKKAKKAKRVRP